jgi:hypothetical protein
MAGRQYTNPSTRPQARHPGSCRAVTGVAGPIIFPEFSTGGTCRKQTRKKGNKSRQMGTKYQHKLMCRCPILNRRWDAGNDKFPRDVGGMHGMPEQKRFRGRHRVQTPRGDQCLRLGTSVAAFILSPIFLTAHKIVNRRPAKSKGWS